MSQEFINSIQLENDLFLLDVGTYHLKFIQINKFNDSNLLRYDLIKTITLQTDKAKVLKKIQNFYLDFKKTKASNFLFSTSIGLHFFKLNQSDYRKKLNFLKKEFVILKEPLITKFDDEYIYFQAYKKNILNLSIKDLKIKKYYPSLKYHNFFNSAKNTLNYSLSIDERQSNHYFSLLDIGRHHSVVIIVKNNEIYSFKHFNKGGDTITEMISQKLNVSSEDAERIKKAEYEKTLHLLTPILNSFFREIEQYFKTIKSENNITIQKIILSGGSANLTGFNYHIQSVLEIPTQTWGIRGNLQLDSRTIDQRQFIKDEPSFASCFGTIASYLLPETKTHSISKYIIAWQRLFRTTKTLIILLVFLSIIYGLGIYIENLKIVQNYFQDKALKNEISMAKDSDRYFQLQGIQFEEGNSFVLINGKTYRKNDSLKDQLIVSTIYPSYVILSNGYDQIKLSLKDYFILPKSSNTSEKN